MIFTAASWSKKLPDDLPDSVSATEFMFEEKYGRRPFDKSLDAFVDVATGKRTSALELKERTELLARGMAKEFGWSRNGGSQWDKMVNVFSLNSAEYQILSLAVIQLNAICTPANAAYSAKELEHQLRETGSKYVFTCGPLLPAAKAAAKGAGILEDRIYLVEAAPELGQYKSVEDLIRLGEKEPPLERLQWKPGQSRTQVAYLCYSSGTSGLPKGVMISHHNLICSAYSNLVWDIVQREMEFGSKPDRRVCLGLLPMSHIFGMIVTYAYVLSGDSTVILKGFDFIQVLEALQKYKVNLACVVPPIALALKSQKKLVSTYDLSNLRSIVVGGAPFGKQTSEEVARSLPGITIRGGSGTTETTGVVSSNSLNDNMHGTVGSLLPGYRAKIIKPDGSEGGFEERGELLLSGPTITLGYYKNEAATRSSFVDGWYKTGDECMFVKSPAGHAHLVITDRMKDLIKVNAFQVAPAELEAHVLTHPTVMDCCVIGIPHKRSGEIPKAYVVKSSLAKGSDEEVKRRIAKHVEEHKANYKWLAGGIEFIDAIPKNASGKILRKMLREKARTERGKIKAKRFFAEIFGPKL